MTDKEQAKDVEGADAVDELKKQDPNQITPYDSTDKSAVVGEKDLIAPGKSNGGP